MNMSPVTPGPIQSVGTFLYQLNAHPDSVKANLWGGCIAAHNGYSAEYLHKAVKLMLAAEDMLKALESAHRFLRKNGCDMHLIDAAIAKATG